MNKMLRAILIPATLALASAANAQTYPSRPITLIINQEAGGPTDVFGRALGKAFTDRGNPPVIVETRPGASGAIGVNACAKAKPDGYTMCIVPRDMISIVPFQEKLEFDPVKDLEPVTQLGWLANVIVAHPSLPFDSMKGMIDYAKKNPGKLNYTAFATAQAIMQWIQNETGTQMTFVPFKGGPSGMQAFYAGDIQIMYLAVGNPGLVSQIKAGKMRALAMPDPHPLLPGVPSFTEAGLPQFGFRSWLGLFMPAGVPKEAVAKVSGDMQAVVKTPAFQTSVMVPMGYAAIGNTPAEFAKFLAQDRRDGEKLAKLAGTRVQ